MRTAAEVFSQAPSFIYSSTTSWPIAVSRAIVPPQPYSGSPGCPPVTTILHLRADGTAPEFWPIPFATSAPATTPVLFSISLRFIVRLPVRLPLGSQSNRDAGSDGQQ